MRADEPSRTLILWFGTNAPETIGLACQSRRLTLIQVLGAGTPAQFSTARGAIFSVSIGNRSDTIKDQFAKAVRRSLQHGLRVVFISDVAGTLEVDKFLREVFPKRPIDNWATNRQEDLPEEIARWSPGPGWSSSVQLLGDKGYSPEDEILLRRAFGDCTTIKLVKQSEGNSAKVYCVFARLTDSRAGPLPLPFFAKLDRAAKIAREMRNYALFTTAFIPFNQRPNLDARRCAMGDERGIIVGNYIEESESLQDLVERGVARAAIHSLFGGALRGWRTQAYLPDTTFAECSIGESLHFHLPSELRPESREILNRYATAAKTHGAKHPPGELERMLREAGGRRHRTAPMHGDLHGNNIRVHRGEAILIDFASTTHLGPLVADPAALDVALAMRARSLPLQIWLEFVKQAYAFSALRELPPPGDAAAPEAAIWNGMRLIRQIAFSDQGNSTEYAIAVAINLLRRATHEASDVESDERRCWAYWLADRLTCDLMDFERRSHSATKPTGEPRAPGD